MKNIKTHVCICFPQVIRIKQNSYYPISTPATKRKHLETKLNTKKADTKSQPANRKEKGYRGEKEKAHQKKESRVNIKECELKVQTGFRDEALSSQSEQRRRTEEKASLSDEVNG